MRPNMAISTSTVSSRNALFDSAAQIRSAHLVVGPQFRGLAGYSKTSGLEYIAATGYRQRHSCVLFYQQHRGAATLDLADDRKHLLHDDRRKAQRRLVEKQQPWLRHQAAGH